MFFVAVSPNRGDAMALQQGAVPRPRAPAPLVRPCTSPHSGANAPHQALEFPDDTITTGP